MIIKINREDFTVFYGEYIIYNLVYFNDELIGIEINDILSEEQIINCKYIEYKE